MTVTIPDLAPLAPSRVVDIDVVTMGEDAPAAGTVTFTLLQDLRVITSGKIIQASSVVVPLVDGKGAVRLPTRSDSVTDDMGGDWVVLVRKSWSQHLYGIHLDEGVGPISLGDLAPARPLTRREQQWAVTTASLDVETLDPSSTASGTVSLKGGALSFRLRVPRGEQGLPGPGAQESDSAIATYLTSTSQTNTAVRSILPAVNVVHHGAVGDGVTDDSAAFQSAVDQAAAQEVPVMIPPGRWVVGNVDLPSSTTLRGSGPSTVLVQKPTGGVILRSAGVRTFLGTLGTPVPKGATSVTDPLISGLPEGAGLIVHDDHAYSVLSTTYRNGEYLVVDSVSGSTATLSRPVRGSRTGSGAYEVVRGAKLTRVDPVTDVTIEDFRVEGHPDHNNLISVGAVERLRVKNVGTVRASGTVFLIADSFDVEMVNVQIREVEDRIDVGRPGYGIALIGSCLDVRIIGLFAGRSRHAVTTIGNEHGEARNVLITGFLCDASDSLCPIDTHAAGEGWVVSNGRIRGGQTGINIRSKNIRIDGVTIEDSVNACINVLGDAKDVTITNCEMFGAERSIAVGAAQSAVQSGITVSGCIMNRPAQEAIRVSNPISDIRVFQNTIESAGANAIDVFMDCSDVHIEGNLIRGIPKDRNGILSDAGPDTGAGFDVVGNTCETASAAARAVRVMRSSGRVVQNRAIGNFGATANIFQGAAGVTVDGNTHYA